MELGRYTLHRGPKAGKEEPLRNLKCKKCGMEISQKNIKRHLQNVHGVADKNTFAVTELKRPFKCDQCREWFSRKDNLKAHIKNKHSDTTSKQFSCNHCENTYIKKQQLNAHIRNKHSAIQL